ncbi:hypothetical protein KIH86_24385 [Paenibacillus sp. HN-1]|uniref:hypothetical protein n=1 Tax=Paenibacillus TaxID=44249 RepID=UPI001CA7E1FA|nr:MULTISPECIES: hypothetical protein [Paenibacillus]MBY9079163.1 hypothetical protein [Paenibacillus sp. CGMCC 1.18879]MBY9087326.1 hypothetical protein [Paenibacillus sinensis]
MFKYATSSLSKQIQSFKKLITSVVKKHSGPEGLIGYRDTYGFTEDMLGLLGDANEVKKTEEKLEMTLVILEEAFEAFQYADDSDGEIGILIQQTLDSVWEIVNSLDQEEATDRKLVFKRLLMMGSSPVFQGWEEWRINLFNICAEFADMEPLRIQLRAAIESRLAANQGEAYTDYANEGLLKILFRLVQQYEPQEQADKFVEDHLHYTFFRNWAIEESMERGDFGHALELAESGELLDKEFPGLVLKWKKARYDAYRELSLRRDQAALAKELLLDGEYSYYLELESLTEGDKDEFYHSMLVELKAARNWRARDVYLKLIHEKNDQAEMLDYVRANPDAIEEYAERLSTNYPEEIRQIYNQYIQRAARLSSNRSSYKRVCSMLRRYGRIAGKESQTEIIHQFRTEYGKRPAFMDELAKLK